MFFFGGNFLGKIHHHRETRLFAKSHRLNCPLCQSTKSDIVHQGYDDRLGYPDIFNVVVCKVCNYGFIQDPVKMDLVSELYRQYYPNCPNISQSVNLTKRLRARIESQRWFNYLEGSPDLSVFVKPEESVLDIGCSYGASAHPIIERGASWTGIEIDPRCCEYLKSGGLKVYHGVIEQFAEVSKEKFDTIMFSQVLEHLYNPLSALKSAIKLLKNTGRILVCMPNFESRYRKKYGKLWLHWHIPYHVGQWSRESLSFACKELGLCISRFSTNTFFAWWRVQRALRPTIQDG